jgi:hypothetical protein
MPCKKLPPRPSSPYKARLLAYRDFLGDAVKRPLLGNGEVVIVGIRGGGLALVLQLPWKLAAPLKFTVNKVAMAFKVHDIILEVHALCVHDYAGAAALQQDAVQYFIKNKAANPQKVLLASVVLPPIDEDLPPTAEVRTRSNCLDFVTMPVLVDGLPVFAVPSAVLETLRAQEELFKAQGDK